MMRQLARVPWIVAIIGAMWALGACGGEASPVYETVVPTSLNPGSAIPNPTEEVILTLSGDISVKNAGATLAFDMPTLERLGLVKYTIADPWLNNTDVAYTGVLMSDLLKFAGASDSATNIHMVALDDYAVDIPLTDTNKWPILLATRADGEYMTVDNSGPTRIIFPFDAYSEIDKAAYKVLMIWNLKDMEIQ